MNKIIYLIPILLCMLCSQLCIADPLDQKLQASIETARHQYHLPALTVSIKLLNENSLRNYTSGYYSLKDIKPITTDTLFQMGSITKTFTAVLILQLVEKNKLALNDPVTKYLPQYARWSNITIQNLLNHTSGLYNYTHGDFFDAKLRRAPKKIWTMDELANIAYQHPNPALPNTKYLYTNTDYLLLGMILEKITHQSLDIIFQDFFNRYHLNNTFFAATQLTKPMKEKMAHGYNQDGTYSYNQDVTDLSISFSYSAGGVVSTPADINTFLQLLFSGKILPEKSLQTMLTLISSKNLQPVSMTHLTLPTQLTNHTFAEIGIGDGIGLIYLKNLGYFFAHAGGMPGYESLYLYSPSRQVYLTLAYSLKPKNDFIDLAIAEKLLRDILSKPNDNMRDYLSQKLK